ncbi:hypothetical protein VE25_15480 [Devosia geojensis]|uniref:Uncharacterized protein n=1 Tax=Devosia geojensis TaxID=443610 RepID=A0A0F5FPV9_9HYPH|nr:hypothetical protein [Devosia geojensis]KKB10934.1 hypothetical protein VE25_15480 [Devosia geojensis]
MQDQWAIGGVSRDDDAEPRGAPPPEAPPPAPARLPLSARLFVFVVGLVAIAAIAAAGWVYTETQRDMRGLAADIAQIKLSLELFGRQQASAGPAPAAAPATDAGALEAIENRLAILEESWRQAPAAPAAPAASAADSASTLAASGDCMPLDTRFLVTAGDNYPVCGTQSAIEIEEVGENAVVFAGSDPIVVGGSMALPETSCIVAVLSANADGMSGYGEVRVSC